MRASMGDVAWLRVLRRHDATVCRRRSPRIAAATPRRTGSLSGLHSVHNASMCAIAIQTATDEVTLHWNSLCRGQVEKMLEVSAAAACTRPARISALGRRRRCRRQHLDLGTCDNGCSHRGGTDNPAQGAPGRDGGGDTGARCPRLRATQPSRLPQDRRQIAVPPTCQSSAVNPSCDPKLSGARLFPGVLVAFARSDPQHRHSVGSVVGVPMTPRNKRKMACRKDPN